MTTMQPWEKVSHWSISYFSFATLTYFLLLISRKIWLKSCWKVCNLVCFLITYSGGNSWCPYYDYTQKKCRILEPGSNAVLDFAPRFDKSWQFFVQYNPMQHCRIHFACRLLRLQSTIVAKLALNDLKLGTILDMEQNCNEIAGVSINLIETSARIHYWW